MKKPLAVTRFRADCFLYEKPYHYLRVWIWKSFDDMYSMVEHMGIDYKACFRAPAIDACIIDDPESFYFVQNVIGDIHLVLDEFGAGVFAHELQHFMLSYIDLCGVDVFEMMGDKNEFLCDMTGKITSDFWVWFYDEFSLVDAEDFFDEQGI